MLRQLDKMIFPSEGITVYTVSLSFCFMSLISLSLIIFRLGDSSIAESISMSSFESKEEVKEFYYF